MLARKTPFFTGVPKKTVFVLTGKALFAMDSLSYFLRI